MLFEMFACVEMWNGIFMDFANSIAEGSQRITASISAFCAAVIVFCIFLRSVS